MAQSSERCARALAEANLDSRLPKIDSAPSLLTVNLGYACVSAGTKRMSCV